MTEKRSGTKSTVEEIRQFFDADVESFSNLKSGQSAAVDSPLAISLIAEVAAATTPKATSVLDVGCGAGNYTLKLLERLPNLDVTLIDLSKVMLDRATARIQAIGHSDIEVIQDDIRNVVMDSPRFDIVLASMVLHHLRDEAQWRAVFKKLYLGLRPGGSIWIFDLVDSAIPEVQATMRRRYGEYLTQLGGEAYRDWAFSHIEQEDTPRSLMFQLDLLREVGFSQVEVLHKNACFAAFGAVKAGTLP